ncbi:MAG: 5-(carboxyamino)imidazole ribonucleotide synthase [Opitutales bacterium]|nr:5-(carboxyamino)imidazole ribonucleotide synthase [Opitutales bacterium]
MILKGNNWLGVLGGGQLGRMLSLDARRMGFNVLAWTGGDRSGAAATADQIIDAPFDDPNALDEFTKKVQVATVEFENLPQTTLEKVEDRVKLFPSPQAVTICQHREREKNFLSEHGFACAKFRVAHDLITFKHAIHELHCDVIVKTAEFGYDGKGQVRLNKSLSEQEITQAWEAFNGGRVVIEECISLQAELSVIVARSSKCEILTYDPVENIHRNHILDVSIVPARIPESIQAEAKDIALSIADTLQYVGILAVEFFLSADGRLVVNELAPRPHNSGHHTLNACTCSQFENQARAIAGLPLGSTKLLSPVVMMNLLGDLWIDENTPPNWDPITSSQGASLHLYGKREARAGRKMGHATFMNSSLEKTIEQINVAREFFKLPAV